MSRSKRWCFTLNNPTADLIFNPATMAYLVYCRERGEEGTEHFQGYVRFKVRKALNTVRGVFPNAHWEVSKGSEQQNRDYCTKEPIDGRIYEYGVFDPTQGNQGRRSDLAVVCEALKTKKKEEVFIENIELYVRYSGGLDKAAELLKGSIPAERDIHTIVLWGETGTGKSHRAHRFSPDAYYGTVGVGTFDKYDGESVVVLDEFDPLTIPLEQILQWTDKWRCQLKCRYANKWARWTTIIIISNLEPGRWYLTAEPRQRDALFRRLSAPMGKVFQVLGVEQELDLEFWKPPINELAKMVRTELLRASPRSPTPPMDPQILNGDVPIVPLADAETLRMKRTTSSPLPSLVLLWDEPPLQRQRVLGPNEAGSSSEMVDL